MPKRIPGSGWVPPLRSHRGRDGKLRARVRVGGVDHYLGEYGSPEAERRYHEFVADWLAGASTSQTLPSSPSKTILVTHLLEAWTQHAEAEYKKPNGRKSSELCIYAILTKYLL